MVLETRPGKNNHACGSGKSQHEIKVPNVRQVQEKSTGEVSHEGEEQTCHDVGQVTSLLLVTGRRSGGAPSKRRLAKRRP